MPFLSDKIFKLWNACEVRFMVLLSLSLQIVLLIFGSKRKHNARKWIRILVWLAYLSADMVATVALGNIAKNQRDSSLGDTSENPINFIQAFWAPFLLLHLGGPDTITPYSLEDNELWLRHLLGLGVQVGVAFYVLVKSWGSNPFAFFAIPMLVAGVIKYGERNWVLKSSSTEHMKKSLLSAPVKDYSLLQAPFGFIIPERSIDRQIEVSAFDSLEDFLGRGNQNFLHYPFLLFKLSTYLFQDLILSNKYALHSRRILVDKPSKQAFEMIETELSFIYDLLYTKASIVYSRFGIFLRSISFLSCFSVLIAFSIHVYPHTYPSAAADITISLLLLVSAVSLEVYSFILFVRSDWTKLWLMSKQDVKTQRSSSNHKLEKKWSRSLGQYSIINSCSKQKASDRRAIGRIMKIFGIDEELEYWKADWINVNDALKQCISERIKEIDGEIRGDTEESLSFDYPDLRKKVLDRRGEAALERNLDMDVFRYIKHCTSPIALDRSVILWHIATDLCFFADPPHAVVSDGSSALEDSDHLQTAKCLSDYMMFLFRFRPSMCPKGIREFSYSHKDACEAIYKFIAETKKHRREEICNGLLDYSNQYPFPEKHVLIDAIVLARHLNEIRDSQKKWKVIRDVWVEMVMYTANHCEWKEHAQHLRKGGEFVTHVCLFMTHMGLSEQFQELEFGKAQQLLVEALMSAFS